MTGRRLSDIAADPRGFWRELTGDSHPRWIGPEKGVIHLATAALVNAAWDLWARAEGKPLWKLMVDMPPEQLVGCVDFRYMTDALTPEQAVELLESRSTGKAELSGCSAGQGHPKNENTGAVMVTTSNLNNPVVRQFVTPRCGSPRQVDIG